LVEDGEGRLTSHPTYICMPSQPPSPVTSALAAEIRSNAPHLHGSQQLESGAGSKRYELIFPFTRTTTRKAHPPSTYRASEREEYVTFRLETSANYQLRWNHHRKYYFL
jgi:hypothetical protein